MLGGFCCEHIQEDALNKTMLCQPGVCSFVTKAASAQAANASSVLIVNNDDSVFAMGGDGEGLVIPVLMLASSVGRSA